LKLIRRRQVIIQFRQQVKKRAAELFSSCSLCNAELGIGNNLWVFGPEFLFLSKIHFESLKIFERIENGSAAGNIVKNIASPSHSLFW
jgi:hypothetical protein